ncbi:MAG: cardiolipin synthase [Thermodesulfobacteriota bacterium]|nr:cardiolipin synthase [Thermodesulfobacteriota bacterium]
MPSWNTLFIFALYLYIFVMIIYLLLDNRETATTLSWLLIFFFLPFVGLVLYFLLGRGMRPRVKKKLLPQDLENRLHYCNEKLIARQEQEIENLHAEYDSPENRKLIRLLTHNSDSVLTRHNHVQVFFNGEDKFGTLIQDLTAAENYIHMEYFIWQDDSFTEKVVDILQQKVRQGVAVRVLYDVVGNYLSKRYLNRLRKSGIRIYPYYNFKSLFKIHTLNYRNHRKIIIIDGSTGYIGGMNMGEEYIDGGSRFSTWRDTHIRIQGESVAVLQGVFSVSWSNTTKEILDMKEMVPQTISASSVTRLQVTTSGPDSQWDSIRQLYFLLISSAEKFIFIHTPYFIPDASIVMALKTAALSGIDVRIMLTGVVDKRIPYWAAQTYLKDLLEAGVSFYYYTKGFMHAKTIVVDARICSVGSANLDIRSLELNYEINALIYDKDISHKLEHIFYRDMKSARPFTLADYNKIHRLKQLRNSLTRLFAPLL